MVESLDSSVLDETSGIGDDTTGGAANVVVDLEYFLYALGHNKSGVESPLYSQDDSLGYFDSYCR